MINSAVTIVELEHDSQALHMPFHASSILLTWSTNKKGITEVNISPIISKRVERKINTQNGDNCR